MDKEALMGRFFNGKPGSRWTYDDSECFLCMTRLTDATRTREHIFPKWLLRRHDLWRESMTLMNGTLIKYGQLTIPCCSDCNNNHLSAMEIEVSNAFEAGYEGVQSLDRRTLFSWLAKIFYGLLVKERHILLDRRSQSGESILSDADLDRFAMHHLLMQSVRGDVVWSSEENPWSIFLLKCQTSETPSLNFDYIDSNHIPFLSIRVGEVAVVASLQDWGYLETGVEFRHMVAARQLELHPYQFKELALVACYTSMLFFRDRDHMLLSGHGQTTILPLPFPDRTTLNIKDPKLLHLASDFSLHFRTPRKYLVEGNRMISTLAGDDGAPWNMPWDGTNGFPMLSVHALDSDGRPILPRSVDDLKNAES